MRIVLASQSPSRALILIQAGVTPLIDPAHIDEDAVLAAHSSEPAAARVQALAVAKCESVAARHPNEIVIGCDSMLLMDGELQGKPHTVEKTIERWKAQRGNSAELITGHCIISPTGRFEETTATRISFGDPTDEDIAAYARSNEPLQCAGAFTLEALGGWFIDSLQGDPSNVIGLSLPTLRRGLYHLGHSVNEFWGTPTT